MQDLFKNTLMPGQKEKRKSPAFEPMASRQRGVPTTIALVQCFFSHTLYLHQFAARWHGYQISFFNLHGQTRASKLQCLDPFLSYHRIPERKTIWTTLGLNPACQLRQQARSPLPHRLAAFKFIKITEKEKIQLNHYYLN